MRTLQVMIQNEWNEHTSQVMNNVYIESRGCSFLRSDSVDSLSNNACYLAGICKDS